MMFPCVDAHGRTTGAALSDAGAVVGPGRWWCGGLVKGVRSAFAKVHEQVEKLSAEAGLALQFGELMSPLLAYIHDLKVCCPPCCYSASFRGMQESALLTCSAAAAAAAAAPCTMR